MNRDFARPDARPFPRPRTGRTIALVDARFIDWLGAPQDAAKGPRRERLGALLEAILEQAGLPPDLARTYWYDSDGRGLKINGQVLRLINPESADGGASLALSMARDLAALADSAACDHVLVATDDDRLLVAVDAAQQKGLRVHLLADESAQDLEALAKTDAAWSTLLRQADTRIIVAGTEVERALWGDGEVVLAQRPAVAQTRHWPDAREGEDVPRGRREAPRGAHPGPERNRADTGDDFEHRPPRDERMGRMGREPRGNAPSSQDLQSMRGALQPLLADWWDGLPVEDREEFVESLPVQRGLPQEVDRQLLLRLSQRLGRPLSFSEKKVMRELAREVCTPPSPDAATAAPAEPAAVTPGA